MTKVLFAASEAVPFVKTGGLADVMSALPKALKQVGVDVALVIPKYEHMNAAYKDKLEKVYEGYVDLSWRQQYFGVEKTVVDGITVYFIDNEWYFKRDGLYGYGDDCERFAFFSKAVLAMLPHIDFRPDIIHCNDWHTGILGAYLKESFFHDEFYWGIKTVFTIHNLKYQGIFGREIVNDLLGLPHYCFTEGKIEFGGCVNFVKAGMEYADYITTVSPTYAKEITYPYFGEGLDGYVRSCQDKIMGIINGLDETAYNPATDKFIAAQYNADTVLEKKYLNKEKLQKDLGLPVDRNIPMIAMVSRLVEDKGISLLTRIMDEVSQEDIQFVLLGAGDQDLQNALLAWAKRNPTKVSINLRFSEELAHKIYAAADIFAMPSRFEACGLSQLIALKYGTIPVVRETGGLKDTITMYNKYTGDGNGLTFANFNAHEFLFTLKTALSYFEDKVLWNKLVNNAMHSDFSWNDSALAYKKVYETVMKNEFDAKVPKKAEAVKEVAPKNEAAKKAEEVKVEVAPKVETPKKAEEVKVEVAPKVETPKKAEEVKVEVAPKVETPKKAEEVKVEVAPKVEAAKKAEEVKIEVAPKAEVKAEAETEPVAEPVAKKAAAKKAPAKKRATKTVKVAKAAKVTKKAATKKTTTKKNSVKSAAAAARDVVKKAVAKAIATKKTKTGK